MTIPDELKAKMKRLQSAVGFTAWLPDPTVEDVDRLLDWMKVVVEELEETKRKDNV